MSRTTALLVFFTSSVWLTGAVNGACPRSDLTGDCRVNWQDLVQFSARWLNVEESSADFNGDEQVDLLDLAILSKGWRAKGISLGINEIMARNRTCVADPHGEYDDWLEIHNFGPESVDLEGMYLTDDQSNPTLWRFPAVSVPSGGYVVIWADSDLEDAGLHASFELDADEGESIALFGTDGRTLVDLVRFGPQTADVSSGREPDAGDRWVTLKPSLGRSNDGSYWGVVADTKFSVDRGFYAAPFSVVITTRTPDATIRYTTDGSTPTESHGQIYQTPVSIGTTTCLRAMACKPGWKSTNIDTQTYIFLRDVIAQSQTRVLNAGYPAEWYGGTPADYGMDPDVCLHTDYAHMMEETMLSIPTLSLVTDKEHLFSDSKDPDTGGIYIYTGHESTGGQGWERPVSAELFDREGTREFQVNCGLRIQGGESRRPSKCPKHSFGLRFRGKYGPTKLKFPLFDGSPVNRFDSLNLRGSYNDSWLHSFNPREHAQYLRDRWMRCSLLEMGQIDAGRGLFVHLYLNGIYWGVYDLHERPVDSHYAEYFGCDKDDVDARNGDRMVDGDSVAWDEMKSIVAGRNWEMIRRVLDVENYIDWCIVSRFGHNTDLRKDANWRAAGGGPNRLPWRFYAWDFEHTLKLAEVADTGSVSDPPGLLSTLDDILEFRVLFGDRLHRHFFYGGALTAEATARRWSEQADLLDLAIIGESARWGDYQLDHGWSTPVDLYTRNDYWLPEKNAMLSDYFPSRSASVLAAYRNAGLYPRIDAPVFCVKGIEQHGGSITGADQLSMILPRPGASAADTIWYTIDGSDPRLEGGYINRNAIRYGSPFHLTANTSIKARTYRERQWSALNEAIYTVDGSSGNGNSAP